MDTISQDNGDYSEQASADYIFENWHLLFSPNFRLISREVGVWGALYDSPDEPPWRIDFVAMLGSRKYLIECDLNNSTTATWHCFKLFGYRAAYCLDNIKKISSVGILAFFPDKIFSHRIRNIFSLLNFDYCTFKNYGSIWRPIRSSLKGFTRFCNLPEYKQEARIESKRNSILT